MSDIMKLIKRNYDMEKEISVLERQIQELKTTIKNNERQIYIGCKHEWSYDSSGGPYDRIKYICNICGLWRCDSMYM